MEERQIIPNSIMDAVAEVLGSNYNSHGKLNTLFQESVAPGEPPGGNCVEKCRAWLSRCNEDYDTNPLKVLGHAIQDFIDADPTEISQDHKEGQEKIRKAHAKNGLNYHLNGIIFTAGLGPVSKVETEPPGAITAASAILESLCKTYIEDNGLQMPDKQKLGPLWKTIRGCLLPADLLSPFADDLQRIMSGLTSVLDGIAALRTHVGSISAWHRPFCPISRTNRCQAVSQFNTHCHDVHPGDLAEPEEVMSPQIIRSLFSRN